MKLYDSRTVNIENKGGAPEVPRFESPEQVQMFTSIPGSVRGTLERCIDLVNRPSGEEYNSIGAKGYETMHSIDHCQKLMRTYCAEDFSEHAYKAAALGYAKDVESGLDGRVLSSIRAGNALRDFFMANSDDYYSDENIYIAGLLQDRNRLDEFKNEVKNHDSDHFEKYQPTKSDWLTDPELTDPEVLYNAVNTLNMESILISGVETLHMLSEHGGDDVETLDLVRYSEQIIAPIAEVMGLDALAMSLNSCTKIMRLKNAGRSDLVYMAESVIERYADLDPRRDLAENSKQVFSGIVGDVLGPVAMHKFAPRMPVEYNANNGSVYGDTLTDSIDVGGRSVDVSWRYRLKSVGSLAWKMHKAEQMGRDISVTPMDIFGITAVVDNVEDQKALFQSIVSGMYNADNTDPYPAPSKSSAVHIRGQSTYINYMSYGLDKSIEIDKHESYTPDSLHLCKVTGFHRGNLPFEIQCVTRHFRDSMQTGNLAHILYKNNTDNITSDSEPRKWEGLLADIRSRRELLQCPGLVGADRTPQADSVQQAKTYLKYIAESRQVVNRTIGYVAAGSIE